MCVYVSRGFSWFSGLLSQDSNIDLEGLEEAMAQSVAALAAKEGNPQRERPGVAALLELT